MSKRRLVDLRLVAGAFGGRFDSEKTGASGPASSRRFLGRQVEVVGLGVVLKVVAGGRAGFRTGALLRRMVGREGATGFGLNCLGGSEGSRGSANSGGRGGASV